MSTRTVKFGRQSGADEESYGYGASGYASYWKNVASSGADQDDDNAEDDDDDDEEEDDEDNEEEGDEDEEGAADSMACLNL